MRRASSNASFTALPRTPEEAATTPTTGTHQACEVHHRHNQPSRRPGRLLVSSRSHPRLDQLEAERHTMLEELDRRIEIERVTAEAEWAAEAAATAAAASTAAKPAAAHAPALYDATIADIDGFLIDLDGTIYRPGSLLPGAQEFYAWLTSTGKPFVFLSNTGAKGSQGVQKKLQTAPYTLNGPPLQLRNAYTAAEAQMEYLRHTVHTGSKVFVISGGDFWMNMLRMKDPLLYDSLDLRTNLSMEEAKQWAVCAKASSDAVFVVFFIDGQISETPDPSSGAAGVTDWSFDTITKASMMCHAGAKFVYTADDGYNPTVDEAFPDMVFPSPGPGMFAAMMKTVMYPAQNANWCCCGKGGNVGTSYMMEHAIQMLRLQGHSGQRSRIMMIGDRFDTDIKAGNTVGIKTCLVETGCHSADMQRHFLTDALADYYAPNVGALVPRAGKAGGEHEELNEDEYTTVQSTVVQSPTFQQLLGPSSTTTPQASTGTVHQAPTEQPAPSPPADAAYYSFGMPFEPVAYEPAVASTASHHGSQATATGYLHCPVYPESARPPVWLALDMSCARPDMVAEDDAETEAAEEPGVREDHDDEDDEYQTVRSTVVKSSSLFLSPAAFAPPAANLPPPEESRSQICCESDSDEEYSEAYDDGAGDFAIPAPPARAGAAGAGSWGSGVFEAPPSPPNCPYEEMAQAWPRGAADPAQAGTTHTADGKQHGLVALEMAPSASILRQLTFSPAADRQSEDRWVKNRYITTAGPPEGESTLCTIAAGQA